MEYLSACPVCQEKNFNPYLACEDHTVSHETFHLQKCQRCGFVVTNPRPTEAELPKYYLSEAYISHSDKSLSLIDQVYKLSRTFTLKWKYALIHKHCVTKPSSVLDYGCGTGAFLQKCKNHQLKISGVEPSPVARAQAMERTSGDIVSSIDEVTGRFDAITLWHVLEHVSNLHETITSLKKHLHENGTMFIAVPNLHSKDAHRYKQYWAGYDVPRHLWHFSRNTMEMLLTRHHLKLTNVVPMRLDAYYVSLLSEKYINGNNSISGMAQAALQGLSSNRSAKKNGEYSSLIYIARK